MKVCLFGGAFDPPHLGHQLMVQTMLNKGLADQVWFVPAYKHSFDKDMSKAEHRLNMLKMAKIPQTRIELCEIERKGESKTVDTLNFLSRHYPDYKFSWLIGSDNLEKFHLWDDYQQMLSDHTFYVYPRADHDLAPTYDGMVILKNVKKVKLSSTRLRQKIIKGESIKGLVLEKVRQYILEHRLYQ